MVMLMMCLHVLHTNRLKGWVYKEAKYVQKDIWKLIKWKLFL